MEAGKGDELDEFIRGPAKSAQRFMTVFEIHQILFFGIA
jgi:hypothetical protein